MFFCFFIGSVYPFFWTPLSGFMIFCAHQEVSSVRKIMQTLKHLRFLRIFSILLRFFAYFFLQFCFVPSFEHIIQKRSHLRNENIYRSFSIKNAILCGRCFTKGKLFTFSVHFVPCAFSRAGNRRQTIYFGSSVSYGVGKWAKYNVCRPRLPTWIPHTQSASIHMEETVPWKFLESSTKLIFARLSFLSIHVDASSISPPSFRSPCSLFFGGVEIGTRCIFDCFGWEWEHSLIHSWCMHSHNYNSRHQVFHTRTPQN